MLISLKKLKYFNLKDTVAILKRGDIDPINRWIDGKWHRCLVSDHKTAIVEVFEAKDKICINVLTGDMPAQKIKEQISRILGLDDPLLDTESEICNQHPILKDLQGIALPGYGNLFEGIVQTILGQLISSLAANKVRCAFVKTFGTRVSYNDEEYYIFPSLESIALKEPQELQKIGTTHVKAKSLREAALHFQDHTWLQELTAENASITRRHELLMQIHGIGLWTSSWFLLRALRQFNVVPSTDLVIRKALTWWWGGKDLMTPVEIDAKANLFGELKGVIAYRIMCCYLRQKKGSSLDM